MEVSQKDWKLFRALVPQWQEAYMERLCHSYIELLNAQSNASDRLWELDKRLKEDKKSLGVSIQMRKSSMIPNLAELILDDVITISDLCSFSKELQDEIKYRIVLESRPYPRFIFENPKKIAEPCKGEEIFVNGIFHFNISALLRSLESNTDKPEIVKVSVSDWVGRVSTDSTSSEYIDAADLNRPVLLLEMAPDLIQYDKTINESDLAVRGYVLADGIHRLEKARLEGISELPAYLIRMEDHYQYLYQGYREYMDYWNQKLSEREKDYFRREGYYFKL